HDAARVRDPVEQLRVLVQRVRGARGAPRTTEDRGRRAVCLAAAPSLRERRLHLEQRARSRDEREPRLRGGLPGVPDRRVDHPPKRAYGDLRDPSWRAYQMLPSPAWALRPPPVTLLYWPVPRTTLQRVITTAGTTPLTSSFRTSTHSVFSSRMTSVPRRPLNVNV